MHNERNAGRKPLHGEPLVKWSIAIRADQREAIQAAAEAEGITQAEWFRGVLDNALGTQPPDSADNGQEVER